MEGKVSLSPNATSWAQREGVRGLELVRAVLLIQPTLRPKLIWVLEVPLAMRRPPHGHGNRGLVVKC